MKVRQPTHKIKGIPHSCLTQQVQQNNASLNKNKRQKNVLLKESNKFGQSFLNKEEFCVCPEFYALWRNQSLVKQLQVGSVTIRTYSKGRKELKHSNNSIQIIYGQIRLTKFPNGDFKMSDGDKITYWNQQLSQIDVFFAH